MVEAGMIKRIKNVFALPFCAYHSGPAQDGKMLGSYCLNKPEVHKDVGNGAGFFLVDKQDNVYTEFVIERPHEVMRFAQLQFVAVK